MVKTRKSGRGRKKKGAKGAGSCVQSSKTVRKGRKKTVKNEHPDTSNSLVSPFKGYDELRSPDRPQHFQTDFDRLFDDESKINLNRGIRTYSNKNRLKPMTETGLLEFQNCKNRDDIVRWLNDNRNVFDRLTQTQQASNVASEDLTLDMPSVSQQKTPKTNRSHREKRKTYRSPYKLRARSLDIQITKNVRTGRSKRHSLAGDTPVLENYHIEDFTDEENLIPVEKEAAFVDLMEGEYLNNVEEMFQSGKRNQSTTGWERIKDINKTIGKKQPKQLKIVKSPITKGASINNNLLTYDYDVLENYFIENMEKVIQEENGIKSPKSGRFSLKNALQVGKNFITILKKIVEKDGSDGVIECQPLMNDLKLIFMKFNANSCTQTAIDNQDKNVQTEINYLSVFVQTETNSVHTGIQTEIKVNSDKNIQTETKMVDVQVQTEEVTKSIVRSVTTSTPSDLVNLDENLSEVFDVDFDTEDIKQKITEKESECDVFDDGLDFNVNTEELTREIPQSVLVISTESNNNNNNDNKGVKRNMESPVDREMGRPKRPCAKFIDENLSVGFSSCVENEERKITVLSEESDDFNYDEYLAKLCKNYEDAGKENSTPKTRTQEQIEDLEKIIYNATKPVNPPPKLEGDLDYFRPYSEATVRKSRRNLFDSKVDNGQKFSESLFGDDCDMTVVANRTLTEDNVDAIIRDKEGRGIKILENVVVRHAGKDTRDKNIDIASQTSDDIFFSDVDVVESTPQKTGSGFFKQRQESALDITLPPPLEFQDTEKEDLDLPVKKITEPSPRRVLVPINKITSTPRSERFDSERLSLSPIPCLGKSLPKGPESAQWKKPVLTPNKALNPIEMAQQSKFSPLTIVKKSPQNVPHLIPKQQKSILSYVRPSQEAQEDSSQKNKPCIACSRVSRDQVMAISSMTNKKLATYSASFTKNVTHLIVSINERNCLKDHTIKFVSAVAAGIWVLSFGWVKECLHKNRLVPEEPYEVCDVSGVPGPRQSRLLKGTKPLLKGYKMCAADPFTSATRQEVENVMRMLGAKVVPSPGDLFDKNGFICVIVTEARTSQNFEDYETWLEALKVATVDVEWLSRSVGQYQLLSLRPFTLCSDDTLESLNYPPELIANMTYSFSQQTFNSVPTT